MKFPLEIRHQVASCFLHQTANAWYDWDLPTTFWDDSPLDCHDESDYNVQSPLHSEKLDLSVLLQLRLVSRDWNATVSDLLYNHFWWPLRFSSKEQLMQALECCTYPTGPPLKNLSLTGLDDTMTFRRVYKYDSERARRRNHDLSFVEASNCQDQLLPRTDNAEPQFHMDKSNEHALLCGIFGSLQMVQAFQLSFPAATVNTYERRNSLATCYDVLAVEEVLSTVQLAFKTDAFQHLTDLRVNLPCTRDILRLSDVMNTDRYHRLMHLRIYIMDQTGTDGACDIFNTLDSDEEGVLDGDSTYDSVPPSNVQVQYPNREYQYLVWNFVACCPNLESLGIKGTHLLDLDYLKWPQQPWSRGLRFLSLSRVVTSIPSIIGLLNPPSNEDLPQVECINLHHVKICADGGDWAQLFLYLYDHCPNLAACRVQQLTYFSTHKNFLFESKPWDSFNIIWTQSDLDWQMLRVLTKRLVDKAGGEENYPNSCYADVILDEDDYDDDDDYDDEDMIE